MFICSCIAKKENVRNKVGKPNHKDEVDDKFFLKERIPDCDSAIAYMKKVIIPVRALPEIESLYPADKRTWVKILDNNMEMWKDDSYNYYLNGDCFLNEPVEKIFEIFCPEDTQLEFLELSEIYKKENTKWFLSVRGLNGFTVGLRIQNGVIIQCIVGDGLKQLPMK